MSRPAHRALVAGEKHPVFPIVCSPIPLLGCWVLAVVGGFAKTGGPRAAKVAAYDEMLAAKPRAEVIADILAANQRNGGPEFSWGESGGSSELVG